MYKPSARYVERRLSEVPTGDRPRTRLIIDLASMLIGPTCSATAESLAMAAARDEIAATELAHAMRDAAERFLAGGR